MLFFFLSVFSSRYPGKKSVSTGVLYKFKYSGRCMHHSMPVYRQDGVCAYIIHHPPLPSPCLISSHAVEIRGMDWPNLQFWGFNLTRDIYI